MTETCELCRRPIGSRREKHHLVPRSRGGRDTVTVHPICHRKIHATFSERDLVGRFATMEGLRDHPEVGRFLAWIADKPPDFHKPTAVAKGRRG